MDNPFPKIGNEVLFDDAGTVSIMVLQDEWHFIGHFGK